MTKSKNTQNNKAEKRTTNNKKTTKNRQTAVKKSKDTFKTFTKLNYKRSQ